MQQDHNKQWNKNQDHKVKQKRHLCLNWTNTSVCLFIKEKIKFPWLSLQPSQEHQCMDINVYRRNYFKEEKKNKHF